MKLCNNGSLENIPKVVFFEKIFLLSKLHDTEILCNISEVSLSGYYQHKKLMLSKSTKEEREHSDREQVKIFCKTRKKGYRRVSMELSRS